MLTAPFTAADSAAHYGDATDLRVRTDPAGGLFAGSDTARDLPLEQSSADTP